jgi:adenylate cyclase
LVKVLSHDVANTVSGVVFHAESLDSIARDPSTKEHAGRIGRLAERLSEILSSVREEEVYNAIKSQALLEKVDLRSACLEAIEHFSWELREKNIHVDLNVPEGLQVKANRVALVNQVLVNLLSNCVKFSDSGGRILLHTEETPDEIRLLVCDQGIGIAKEKLTDLFHGQSIFSSRGTEKEKGSGFGTKLIGEYMKLFGGKVRVESALRGDGTASSGTIVRLVFPRKF